MTENNETKKIIIFAIISLIIMCGLYFLFNDINSKRLTANELFVANSICKYKEHLGETASKFNIQEIRFYKKYDMVLFNYILNDEQTDKKVGYVEFSDVTNKKEKINKEVEGIFEFITDSSLSNELTEYYWNNIEYEVMNKDKIMKYIDKNV